jgi:hypothetical protein
MFVETHAFKESFVQGATGGFVVCTEPPHTPRRLFAEIYGTPDCYHIFETRRAAEFQMSLAAIGTPPRDDLTVTEVRVQNIRDYQLLTGFKTVPLVDRDGHVTQSLRVGDMPLSARIQTPFPFAQREGLRVVHPVPAQKPFAPPPISGEPSAAASRARALPRSLSHRPNVDPFSHVPLDEGERPSRVVPPGASPAPVGPGVLPRLFRALFGPIR